MVRENLNDLTAFLTVARERSFTRAAVKLGVSQPALSQTIKDLEARLGVRLLTRTTRSVAPTPAGERFLQTVGPHFDGIEAGLATLTEMRDRPAGTIRITASEHGAETALWPALEKLLFDYPDINVEVVTEDNLRNIVAERFDAGVRLGEHLERDMVAVRIGPEMRMAVVGTPTYFMNQPVPRQPHELSAHNCISLGRPTRGGNHSWEFDKAGREINVRVTGQLVFTSLSLIRRAALSGLGLAYLPEDRVQEDIREERLVRVLDDWCEPFPGYHLYYPSRHHHSAAFTVLVEALRYRA